MVVQNREGWGRWHVHVVSALRPICRAGIIIPSGFTGVPVERQKIVVRVGTFPAIPASLERGGERGGVRMKGSGEKPADQGQGDHTTTRVSHAIFESRA